MAEDGGILGALGAVKGFTYYGSKVPGTAGYKNNSVPDEYIATIISSQIGIVRAVLQDTVKIGVGSEWEPFMGESFDNNALGQAAEMTAQVFKKSLKNVVTSRRKWKSTAPVQISLDLVFQEESNAQEEVVKPCAMLQAMSLPAETFMGFLVPPGPSPFSTKMPNGKSLEFNPEASDIIAVYIGTFLGFRNVIVKSVDVTFDTRYNEKGFPIAAKVNLVFQTYEVLTKGKLGDVYKMSNDEERSTSDSQSMRITSGME